jgi:DNA repair exonuclease SbcCD ATPase subunit
MKLVVSLLIGFFLFIASAGVSYMYLVPPELDTEEEVIPEEEQGHTPPNMIADSKKTDEMPVAVRPSAPITIEAVMELSQSILEKEKAVGQAQEQVKRDEKRLKMLFEDLKREQEQLGVFAKRVDDQLMQAREAIEELKLEKQAIAREKDSLQKLQKETGGFDDVVSEKLDKRVQTVKSWFKNLEPEPAAKYLKEFAQAGDLEFVARLLDSLEDRRIAKILATLDDAPLVAKIVNKFTGKSKAADTIRR